MQYNIDPELQDGLSAVDAMEVRLAAISAGDINALAASTAQKRTHSEAELDDDSRAPSPSPPAESAGSSADRSLVLSARRPAALNAAQVARSLGESKKRKADHVSELVSFAEMSSVEREVATFDMMLELRNLIRFQYAENDNWTMSKNLKDDVRAYAQAVILAPALPCYLVDSGSIQNLLTARGVFPVAWSSFGSRTTIIRQYAGTCATDERADLKNALKSSIKSGACLSALCRDIVSNTEVKVTAALRHRVAWLRFIWVNHADKRGAKFWEFVDDELRKLRQKMNNDATRLAYAMTLFTTEDEKKFTAGNTEAYELVDDKDLPQLQVASNAAAAAIVPPVPKAV